MVGNKITPFLVFTLTVGLFKGQCVVKGQQSTSSSSSTVAKRQSNKEGKTSSSIVTTAGQGGQNHHSSLLVKGYNTSLVSNVTTILITNNYTDYLLEQNTNNNSGEDKASSLFAPSDVSSSTGSSSKEKTSTTTFQGESFRHSPSPTFIKGGKEKKIVVLDLTIQPTVSPSPSTSKPSMGFVKGQRKTASPTLRQTSSASLVSIQMMKPTGSPTTLAKKSDSAPESTSTKMKTTNHNNCNCSEYSREDCKQCNALYKLGRLRRSDIIMNNTSVTCGRKKCVKRCCDTNSVEFFNATATSSMSYSSPKGDKKKKKKKKKKRKIHHQGSTSSTSSFNVSPSPTSIGSAKRQRKTSSPTQTSPHLAQVQTLNPTNFPSTLTKKTDKRSTAKPKHNEETKHKKKNNKKTTCDCSKYSLEGCKQCIAHYNLGKVKRNDIVKSSTLACGKKKCVKQCCDTSKDVTFYTAASMSYLSSDSSHSDKKKKMNNQGSRSYGNKEGVF